MDTYRAPDFSRPELVAAPEARFLPAPADGVLPEGFFSTTNLPTYVKMAKIAAVMGREAVTREARVAVLKCNGTCEFRPRTSIYDGTQSCAIASALYSGETGCTYGCHGFGDCVDVCQFDALSIDAKTGLPVVNDEKCTACGACVKACPRHLFKLRKKWKGD